VLWLTGLPGAGKSTLARLVAEELRARGGEVAVLDGDVVRRTVSPDLGFSRRDRDENVARVARLADELSGAGAVVVVAMVSPYRAARRRARELLGPRFVEVYVRASPETCERRDPKGLWARARAGEISQFTGVSDPYEEPTAPELVADTERNGPGEAAAQLLDRALDMDVLMPDRLETN
jgi:adenylylsulfate kinase